MSQRRPFRAAVPALLAVLALALTACTSSGGGAKSSSTPGGTGSVQGGSNSPSGPDPESSNPNAPKPVTSAQFPTPGREQTRLKNQAKVLDSLPGSASTKCGVVTAKTTDLRPARVAAGNFVTARKAFADQYGKTEVPQLNLYVIPRTAKGMKKVRVTVDPRGAGKTATAVSKQVETADRSSYFAVTVPVRSPGAYRLTMTSSTGSGCFDVSFSK